MTPGRTPRPPALARALLVKLVPDRHDGHEAVSSLDELYSRRLDRAGALAARLWYWRQVAGFVGRRGSLRRARADEVAADLHPGRGLGRPRWQPARDLRFAARSLRRQPGFSLLAVGTLALGIGANTAIFSVLYGSVLQDLPFPEPERLVWLSDGHEDFGGGGANQSVPNLLDIEAATTTLSDFALFKMRAANLATTDRPERVSVVYASSRFFATLGLPVQLGRDFVPGDDASGAEPVAILADSTWRSRFGADPGVVGHTTRLDGRPVRVIGVAAPAFEFPEGPQIVVALQHLGAGLLRGNRGHFSIGRIAAGADLVQVQAELDGIQAGLADAYPDANADWGLYAAPLADFYVGSQRRSLLLLAAAATLVLLIACVNVSNLMLLRSESRQREFAVRYSLGATRLRMVPVFLGEGLLLALAGALLGLLAARPGVRLLVSLYSDALARADEVTVNAPVLGFALAIALLAGLVVGLIPLVSSRPDRAHETLKEGVRGSAVGSSRLGRALVVAEIALAVLLVIGAGLLAHSMWRLRALDLGVSDGDRVLTFQISAPRAGYADAAAIRDFYESVRQGLDRLPHASAVGFVNRLPLLGGDNTTLRRLDDPEIESNFVSYRMISPGYFEATGLQLLAGRLPTRAEMQEGAPVIIVNTRLARELFDDVDAVGRRIQDPMLPPGARGHRPDGMEIVGIVADVAGGRAGAPAPPAYYSSFEMALRILAMYPELIANEQVAMSYLVRTTADPAELVPGVRDALATIDPEVPLYQVRTLEDIADSRLRGRHFAMSLFGLFAGLAVLLGAVGIYGVVSYGVAQRTREIGVRMALGADRGALLRLVLGEGLRLTVPGLALGLVGAALGSRLLESLLFEIRGVDLPTYAAVSVLLALVCLAAMSVPALRATRVDPLTSIRGE